MTKAFFCATFLLSILSFSSCRQKANETGEHSAKNSSDFFTLIQFGNLSIVTRFSECGEWGGHKEEIIISADENRNLFAHYNIFPYNCDSLKYYYANENLKPKIEKTIPLTDKGKKSISDYIQRLTKSKIKETFPGHAGNFFSVTNSDSTLVIKVYDRNQDDVDSYNQLVTELFK